MHKDHFCVTVSPDVLPALQYAICLLDAEVCDYTSQRGPQAPLNEFDDSCAQSLDDAATELKLLAATLQLAAYRRTKRG